jgi:transposase
MFDAASVGAVARRYRCAGCGNVTRFDVEATRRTRAFHHYSLGGDLEIEEEDVLEERIERVTCRWCGATGERIEASDAEELHDQTP